MRIIGLAIAIVVVGCPLASSTFDEACTSPTGIDEEGGSSGITTEQINEILDGTTLEGGNPLPFIWLPLADPLIQSLVTTYETPIQFRQAVYHGMSCYNTVAMYHPTALDIWGRDDKRICANAFASEAQKNAHEQAANAYAFAYSAISVSPTVTKSMTHIMDNVLGLPMSRLQGDPPMSTPWGLAKVMVDQMSEYAKSDGWNADGTLTHDFNKMPFSDFDYEGYTSYKTQSNKNGKLRKINCNKEWYWEPLLESNDAGYFTRQEHVTPFAGFTGRLYGMTSSEYEGFYVSKPEYNFCDEADFVLTETKDMSMDDKKKAEIEFFDSKFTSILLMQIDWAVGNQFSTFDFWFYDMALVTAMYDATMLVWREKVVFDVVRPTTVVHTLKREEEVETYAGAFAGSQTIKGLDWQPYIRTMPHAEYPSGSSCICTAFAETLQLLTGKDGTGPPVGTTFEAGSSKTEPGVTPAKGIELVYTKWSEIQDSCGMSRLHGGMHFSKSVPAGQELCTGVASVVVNRAEMLRTGNSEGALADLNDTSIVVKKRKTGKKK